MMSITEYHKLVVNYFKTHRATDEDWEILGWIMFNARRNDFHRRKRLDEHILSKSEFKELYPEIVLTKKAPPPPNTTTYP